MACRREWRSQRREENWSQDWKQDASLELLQHSTWMVPRISYLRSLLRCETELFIFLPTKYTPPLIFPILVNGTTMDPVPPVRNWKSYWTSLLLLPPHSIHQEVLTALPQKDIPYPITSLHSPCPSPSLGHNKPSPRQLQQPLGWCPSAHILQMAPREVSTKCKSDHITLLFTTLQCLSVALRIKCKLFMLA